MSHRLLLLEPVSPNQEAFADAGIGADTFSIQALLDVFDSAVGTDRSVLGPGIRIQGLVPPQIESIRRIVSLTMGLAPIGCRGAQYTREISNKGDTWEIRGLTDRVTLEQLFALPANGAIWVTDAVRGNFHATLEVEASWAAVDAPQLERTV